MTAVDDLAAWLDQIWDEQEQAARHEIELVRYASEAVSLHAVTYQWVRNVANANGSVISSRVAPGAPTPHEVLARIAADRQILALHSPNQPAAQPWCDTDQLMWPCRTVRLLALPYADRPGYQEAWRPA